MEVEGPCVILSGKVSCGFRENGEVTYSLRISEGCVMPSSAKLGMAQAPMAFSGSCMSPRLARDAALLELPKDMTILKMLAIVVVLGVGLVSK